MHREKAVLRFTKGKGQSVPSPHLLPVGDEIEPKQQQGYTSSYAVLATS